MDDGESAGPVSCAQCGRGEPTAPLDWMRENDPHGRTSWTCSDCQRRYLRSIEAKLDQEWW